MKFNAGGQSLVQLLVAIGVMSVVVLAFAGMMNNQQRSTSQLGQKMATLDLVRTITGALADPSGVCTFMMNNPPLAPFDPLTVGTATPPVFNFTQIPLRGVAGSPNVVAVSTTSPASLLSTTLYVATISATDLACLPAPCTAGTNQFNANLGVGFDGTKLIVPLAPLKFPVVLSTIPSGSLQKIVGCSVSTSATRTWQDVTASRAAQVSYVNSTGHAIELSVSTYSGLGFKRCQISVNVNGVVLGGNFVNGTTTCLCNSTVTVPAGASYLVDDSIDLPRGAGENTVHAWAELR